MSNKETLWCSECDEWVETDEEGVCEMCGTTPVHIEHDDRDWDR